MKIIYEGVDIYPQVSVNACVHDMFAADSSDMLYMRFNDTRKLWGSWQPAVGHTITVEQGTASTGTMYVSDVVPENGLLTLEAMSCPPAGFDPTSRSWEQVWLEQIINDIAAHHGLTVEMYGVDNQLYTYVSQDMISDYVFLSKRLQLESCAFLVFNGKLVVYSEPYMESIAPVAAVEITSDSNFQYRGSGDKKYDMAEIECGVYTGAFTAPDASGQRVLRRSLDTQVGSGPEANRFAQGLLRSENKRAMTATLWESLKPQLAPGSTVELKGAVEPPWSGVAFVEQVRNDYAAGKSKLFLRKPLEGY